MKIKETITTEVDNRGRVIRRTRTVDVIDSENEREHDSRPKFSQFSDFHRASPKRIYEAYEDYRMSKEW
jgi:hypothetical protein